ncbi:MAG: metal-dependent transcriptional regulator [Planctomycetota bacterium]|jgi:DtxR family Mn-dependent transcriptional regulator
MISRKHEEVLEAVWTCTENGNPSIEAIREKSHVEVDNALLAEMEAKGWITVQETKVSFLGPGEELARNVIRRHRLAERLMVDALKMEANDIETPACEVEHSLVPEVTESICTLLGHPRNCPHGLKIPRGRCCRESRDVVDKVAVPAGKLQVGEAARIAYLVPKSHSRLHKLMSFGIHPGVEIRLHQKSPAFVIQCEQTAIALEEDVVDDIYVWRSE